MDMKTWFKQAQYGMMVHWGLYSLLAGEWKGRQGAAYAEWIQANQAIPNREYGRLCKAFNPVFFDADEWVRFARDCGMRYLVVTSKHHDGFALFRSRVDGYNVADATLFGRDVVAELAEACQKYGLKLGLYYSQDLDWHEEHGGGYLSDPSWSAGITWENSWDFPDKSRKHYDLCFENKILPQVEELMRNYGELCLIWFDMPMTLRPEQSQRLYDTVKRFQPDCLVNSRLGNGRYDYVSLGDNEIPDVSPENAGKGSGDMNDINGFKPSPYGLYETAATLNNSWGYCAWDQDWKSPEIIAANRRRLNGMGINYLLNVGPDGLGRIPAASQRILREAARLFNV